MSDLTKFVENAGPALMKLARQANFSVKTLKDLSALSIFEGDLSNFYKIVRGELGMTDDYAAEVRRKLKIDDERLHEWIAITRREFSPKITPAIVEFFKALRFKGLSLSPFLPPWMTDADLVEFCVPARVIREVCEDRNYPQPIRTRCYDALLEIQIGLGWRALRNGGWDSP